jgi:hypothetical protein
MAQLPEFVSFFRNYAGETNFSDDMNDMKDKRQRLATSGNVWQRLAMYGKQSLSPIRLPHQDFSNTLSTSESLRLPWLCGAGSGQ